MHLQIIPTHNELRSLESLKYFIDQLKRGECYRKRPIKLALLTFPFSSFSKHQVDYSQLYCHDGHHALSAAYLLGMKVTKLNVEIETVDLDWFTKPNFKEGYVTPYDPRILVRLPNFFAFKNKIISDNSYSDPKILDSLFGNGTDLSKYGQYRELRIVNTFEELVERSLEKWNVTKSDLI